MHVRRSLPILSGGFSQRSVWSIHFRAMAVNYATSAVGKHPSWFRCGLSAEWWGSCQCNYSVLQLISCIADSHNSRIYHRRCMQADCPFPGGVKTGLYCTHGLMAGTPENNLIKLRKLQNRAASLVVRPRAARGQVGRIIPILKQLHWLTVGHCTNCVFSV